jgi:hypothetical protein
MARRPDRLAGLGPLIVFRLEAQPQRIAIVIADRARPARWRMPRAGKLGDDGRRGLAAPARATSAVPTVRPRSESSRALNDSHSLPVAAMVSTGWPARTFSPISARPR